MAKVTGLQCDMTGEISDQVATIQFRDGDGELYEIELMPNKASELRESVNKVVAPFVEKARHRASTNRSMDARAQSKHDRERVNRERPTLPGVTYPLKERGQLPKVVKRWIAENPETVEKNDADATPAPKTTARKRPTKVA